MQSLKHEQEAFCETIATNVLKPNTEARIVIVGAGLAGLAAAQRLYEAGIKDVVILDAQNRIGGRVYTIDHADYVLELGAQWLHGADDNPLYKWLLEKNMVDDFEDASLSLQGLFCTNKGREVDQKLVKKVLKILIDEKVSLFKNEYTDLISRTGLTNARQVFKHQFDLRVSSDEELQKNKSLSHAIFDWFLRYETIENGCNSMDEVSIASYTDWTDWGDGTLLNFKHGYRSLLQWLCSQMPAESWIHLNKEVVEIETLKHSIAGRCYISNDKNISKVFAKPMLVRYNDCERSKNKLTSNHYTGYIECDHVIVTVSLGYLKKAHKTLFKPRLPELKENVIEAIGFGTVNKIILQFDTPFWKSDYGIKLIWEESLDHLGDEFPTWVRDILAFDIVRRQPNLLIGWIGGEGAKLMEQESNTDIIAICQRMLDKFLPARIKPSRIVSCICSRWNSNQYICGSYSFQSMKSYDQNIDRLHEPIYSNDGAGQDKLVLGTPSRVPRILFAGEATAGKLYSTTHGALITGWREADRLKDYMLGGKKANIQQTANYSKIKCCY